MKALRLATQMAYWLIIACIPLLPVLSLRAFHSEVACSANGICFRYGNFLLNFEGQMIVLLAALLLWPLCICKLFDVVVRRFTKLQIAADKPSRLRRLIAAIYWSTIACVPFLFWYLLGTSLAPSECTGAGSCLDFYTPLDMPSVAVVCVSFFVLWPLCYAKLYPDQKGQSH